MVEGGTVVVIQGPRFSTRAESRWFARSGFDVVNMTQYPECWLARELELCYANVALVTDYDVGLEGMPHVEPVSAEAAFRGVRARTWTGCATCSSGPSRESARSRRTLAPRRCQRDRPIDCRRSFRAVSEAPQIRLQRSALTAR